MSYVAFGASRVTADDCYDAGGWWDHASKSCVYCPPGQIHMQSVQGKGGACVSDPCPAGQRTNRVTYGCEPTSAGRGGPGGEVLRSSSAPLILALGGLMLAGYFFNKRPSPGAGASEWR